MGLACRPNKLLPSPPLSSTPQGLGMGLACLPSKILPPPPPPPPPHLFDVQGQGMGMAYLSREPDPMTQSGVAERISRREVAEGESEPTWCNKNKSQRVLAKSSKGGCPPSFFIQLHSSPPPPPHTLFFGEFSLMWLQWNAKMPPPFC